MESRWYFFTGQNEENTKISDRSHALHITGTAWNNITKHLDRKKIIQEALDKDAAHKKALKEGSAAMTREWADSIENIRIRQQEEREKRLGLKQLDKFKEFRELKEGQMKIRDDIVNKIEKTMFRNKGYCLDLTTALRRSEAIYEREKQIELKNIIKNHEEEEEAAYNQIILENAITEQQEKDEEAKKVDEKRRAHAVEIKKEFERLREETLRQKKEEVEKEIVDRALAEKEIKEIEKIILQEKAAKKLVAKKEKEKYLLEARERRRNEEKADNELDQIGALYVETKQKIACVRKQKDKEVLASYAKRSEAAGKHLLKEQAEKEEKEKERMKNALESAFALEEEKFEAKKMKTKLLVEQRKEWRKQYLQEADKDKNIEREMKKWEMLNRFKQDEVTSEYDKHFVGGDRKKMMEYQQKLLDQMAEDKAIRKAEDEEVKQEEQMRLNSMKEDDDKFFDYANEILDTLKSKQGRCTYPVEQVILRYKKDNDLLPKNKGTSHCTNFKLPTGKKKIWENEKNKSLEQAGFQKCKCCKKLYKDSHTKIKNDESNQ